MRRTDAPSAPPVWDDGAWTPLPALTGDHTADTCVIGLGGSGLTAVAELLDRGESVVGLDAADVGGGAAGRNGGFLLAGTYDFYHHAVTRHGRARALAIYRATCEEITRLAVATPTAVRRVGSRRLAASEAEIVDCQRQLTAMQQDGLPVSWYDGPDGVGLTIPTDAAFNPLDRCRLLAVQAMTRGARLFARSPVQTLTGQRVTTASGVVHCRRVLVLVDGTLELLLPELVGRVRTARLQMLATAPTEERTVPCPQYFRDGFEYWQQLPGGRIALGGFRDAGGLDEWTADTTLTPAVQHRLEQFLREHIGVQAAITHRWAASAGYTSTGLPVIEQVRQDVWAAGGYCGTGNVIGALAARAVVAAAIDHEYAPVRLLLGPQWTPDGPVC